MDYSFTEGFTKTAFVGPLVGAAVRTLGSAAASPLKAVGKGIIRAGGGPLNTALTGLGAAQDYSKGMDKMKRAATR